jgi:hypothetical protein
MTPAELLERGAGALVRASWQAGTLAILVLAICRVFPRIPAR